MCLLVIGTQGVTIRRESRRVYAEKEDAELFEIQTRSVSAVAVLGNAQITTQALALFADEGIPVTFLTCDGGIKGQFLPVANKNMSLRFAQYQAACNPDASLTLARQLVIKKLQSYETFYRNIQKHAPIEDIRILTDALAGLAAEAGRVETHQELLGLEGTATRLHFRHFATLFKGELRFTRRSYYPPEDEANALLCLGYAMLAKLVNGMLHAAGLDVYNGFLHKPSYNRASLTCDLQEPFRAPVVDRLVLSLMNKNQIQKKHFSGSAQGPRLNQEGTQIFFSAWKPIAYSPEGSPLAKAVTAEIEWLSKQLKAGVPES